MPGLRAFDAGRTRARRLSGRTVVYKFTDGLVLNALGGALDRGVTLRVLCDGAEAAERKSLVGALVQAGVEVRLWSPTKGKLHARFTVIEARRVLTGSYNWTTSGGTSNVEILLAREDAETVVSFVRPFHILWEEGQPYRL